MGTNILKSYNTMWVIWFQQERGGNKLNRLRKVERVAAYIRVSTQEQKLHGISLDAQKAKLIAYAKANGMKIVEWYMDEGVSARKLIKKRPELQRMIQDAEKGQFERIIFIKLDRFFRSVAEYHECMKRIAPVVWTTTEEKYDLTTANGRFLINAKLAVAEMEADMASERVNLVNEYKASTGQPLCGNVPFGFKIIRDPDTGRKKIVKDPEYADILEDVIQFFLTHQSKRATGAYLQTKHHISMGYQNICKLLANPMLCGEYRGNPDYCEAYIDKETFLKMQEYGKRNVKSNTERAYFFSGLIICPVCGRKLAGIAQRHKNRQGRRYIYKKYNCAGYSHDNRCTFNKAVNENTIEKMMLANIEKYFEDAKIHAVEITEGDSTKLPKYDIDEIHAEIDRLNYSWQKGRIRKVEQYEEQYQALMEKLEKAETELDSVTPRDFSKVEAILHEGWRSIYDSLDDAYKRAFWRSFIRSIEIEWTTDVKKITKVNFF